LGKEGQKKEEAQYEVTGDSVNAKIGKNVSKVGDKAFDGASKLKTLTFKGNLKSVKSNALSGCKKLKVVKVANKGDIKLIKKVLKKSLGAKAAKKVVVKVG